MFRCRFKIKVKMDKTVPAAWKKNR